MRRYLLGIVAILMAIGLSAYTKPVKKSPTFTTYYFQVSNTTSVCGSVSFSAFPTQVPPTSITSCGGSSDFCWLGYPRYVQVGNEYRPSLDGTSQATSCQSTAQDLQN